MFINSGDKQAPESIQNTHNPHQRSHCRVLVGCQGCLHHPHITCLVSNVVAVSGNKHKNQSKTPTIPIKATIAEFLVGCQGCFHHPQITCLVSNVVGVSGNKHKNQFKTPTIVIRATIAEFLVGCQGLFASPTDDLPCFKCCWSVRHRIY